MQGDCCSRGLLCPAVAPVPITTGCAKWRSSDTHWHLQWFECGAASAVSPWSGCAEPQWSWISTLMLSQFNLGAIFKLSLTIGTCSGTMLNMQLSFNPLVGVFILLSKYSLYQESVFAKSRTFRIFHNFYNHSLLSWVITCCFVSRYGVNMGIRLGLDFVTVVWLLKNCLFFNCW